MLSSPFSLKENGTARTLPLHINRRNALAYRNVRLQAPLPQLLQILSQWSGIIRPSFCF
jgi:hypothetical protein